MRWRTVPLGDLVELTSGFAFKSELFSAEIGGLPLVRIRDVARGFSETNYTGNYDDQFLVVDGDILIGMDGGFNTAKWMGGRALLNQRVCRIDCCSTHLDREYLLRFLPSALKAIEDRTAFVTVKHLSGKDVRAIEIPLPPLDEQRRIAAILDQADALRRKRNATIQRAERFIEASFTEQFGPGTGQTETASLGDLFEIARGGSPRPIDSYLTDNDDGLNWISISDATANGKFISKVKRRIKPSGASKSRRVEPGDFLLTNSMSFGRPYIMATTGYIHDGWLSLRSKDARISQEYLYRALSAPETYAKFSQLASGATVKNLNIDLVRTVRIPVPNRDRQDCFARVATAVDADIERKRRSLHKLDALFAALQHSAFNGELTRSAEPVLHSA